MHNPLIGLSQTCNVYVSLASASLFLLGPLVLIQLGSPISFKGSLIKDYVEIARHVSPSF